MRATMRITWLLLSLSVLSHNVCSEDNGQSTATSVSKGTTATAISVATAATSGGGATAAVPTQVNQPTGGQTTPQPSGGVTTKSETVQTPPAVNPTATDAPPVSTLDSTKKLPQDTTQPPATTVTEKPATPTPPPGAAPTQQNNASPAATTSSQSKMVAQTGTTAGGGNSGQLPSGTTVQTSQTSGSSTVSWTTAPVTLPGDTVNAGTTKTPPASTDAHTTRQQSAAHTTVTSTTDVSKGGIDNTVVIVTSTSQPASKTEAPAGNTGTTSPLSSLTTTRSPAAGTTVAKTGTTSPQNTPTSRPAIIITSITSTTSTMTTTAAVPKTFLYSLNNKHEKEDDKDLVQVCQRLMANLVEGNCNLTIKHHRDKIEFISVLINGKVKTNQATQIYEEITKKPTDNKTLIAILASCGALLIMIVILAVCASHHRKPYNENQQHLTEELHTVENGYHDNPTLDVMEVQPEMKEKTMGLNGEFNDSWIVPIDNLLKEDMPDEEDTHL